MHPAFAILIFVVIGTLIGAAVYYNYLAQKKRREELAALALEMRWQFDPGKDSGHDEEYAKFEIFRRGHSRAAYNTLTGNLTIDGRQFPGRMGDYTYKITSSNGKTTTTRTYNFSYLIIHLPFPGAPDLLIRREGLFDKLKGVLGFDDIDFESAEFSKRFFVKSSDKRFAYDVIHPRMMEFLLQNCPAAVDIECGRCCLSDGSNRWTPEQFKAMTTWIDRFFDQWPDHLTAELER